MRRTTTLLAFVLALLMAACSDDPATETATGDDPASTSTSAPPTTESASTTEAPTASTTAAPTTSEVSTSTTTAPQSALDDDLVVELYVEDEDEFCGDWIPARVGDDLTCRRPDTLPPDPVARGTAWELPVVDGSLVDEFGWHPPLALLNWDTVSLLTVDDPLSAPTVTPWARLHRWADDLRVAADGSIVVAQDGPPDDNVWPAVDVAVYRPDGSDPSVVPDGQYLYDVGSLQGRDVVVYEPDPDDGDDRPLLVAPLDDLAAPYAAFGPARADEWLTTHVDLEDEWAAVLGYVGNDSAIEFRAADGSRVGPVDPIVDHGDPELDSVVALAIASDGARVTWVEYPQDVFDEPDRYVRVKSADLDTGELVFDIPIEDPNVGPTIEPVVSVFDLGDHVIVNTVGFWANRWWPNPAIVVSFAADEPEQWTLPVTGIAVPVPYTVG